MTLYRIVCTEQEPESETHDQAHIVAVGVGDNPDQAEDRMTLEQVYAAMNDGDRFYTKSESTGQEADVHKYECGTCGTRTIRTDADDRADNNLDNLRECNGWN